MDTWQNIELMIGILAKCVIWTLGKISPEGTVSFDELAPFSSDKIQAKILDLGYGGACRAHWVNICQRGSGILLTSFVDVPRCRISGGPRLPVWTNKSFDWPPLSSLGGQRRREVGNELQQNGGIAPRRVRRREARNGKPGTWTWNDECSADDTLIPLGVQLHVGSQGGRKSRSNRHSDVDYKWGCTICGLFVYKLLTECGYSVDFTSINSPHFLCHLKVK